MESQTRRPVMSASAWRAVTENLGVYACYAFSRWLSTRPEEPEPTRMIHLPMMHALLAVSLQGEMNLYVHLDRDRFTVQTGRFVFPFHD